MNLLSFSTEGIAHGQENHYLARVERFDPCHDRSFINKYSDIRQIRPRPYLNKISELNEEIIQCAVKKSFPIARVCSGGYLEKMAD
jgi:hypothetical protein